MIAAPELLDHARGNALIGDTGYDSNEFIKAVRARVTLITQPAVPRWDPDQVLSGTEAQRPQKT
jgi:hypothetical protein